MSELRWRDLGCGEAWRCDARDGQGWGWWLDVDRTGDGWVWEVSALGAAGPGGNWREGVAATVGEAKLAAVEAWRELAGVA